MSATPQPLIEISKTALRANMAHAKNSFAPQGRLMFAVKSNAYGHGDELIIPLAVDSGADELAVLDIDSALRIRSLVPDTPLFTWLSYPGDDFAGAAEAGVECGISALWQLDEIADTVRGTPLTVHLKIDTGLHRNGATAEQWPALVRRAAQLETQGVVRIRAIWSHLADTSLTASQKSLALLREAVAVAEELGVHPDITHLAASHAAVEMPEARLDMVRLGILAYGVSPFDDHSADDLGFSPLLTLSAPVTEVSAETLTLGIGYADGLLRPIDEAIIAVDEGTLGLRDMDATSSTWEILTPAGEFTLGQQVPLLGAGASLSVEAWASLAHTIGDEVLAKLRVSIPRVLVD